MEPGIRRESQVVYRADIRLVSRLVYNKLRQYEFISVNCNLNIHFVRSLDFQEIF